MGHSTIKDIGALYKLRLGFFVVMSAVLGWFMGTEHIDVTSTLLLTVGGYLLTGASNGLNQIFEKDIDAQMKRTMNRPLPSGRMTVSQALFWSILAGVIGIGCLYLLDEIAALLGLTALILLGNCMAPR